MNVSQGRNHQKADKTIFRYYLTLSQLGGGKLRLPPHRLLTQVLCDGDDAKAAMNAHLTMGLDAAWNLGMPWSDLADRTQRKFHSYGSTTTTTMYTTTTTILL